MDKTKRGGKVKSHESVLLTPYPFKTMKQIRVAGAQIPVTRSIQSKLKAIGRATNYTIAEQADILLTPEGSLSGYTSHFDPQQVYEALETVTQRTCAAKLALALGTCFVEPADGLCYNQIRFYRADGAHLGFHSNLKRVLQCAMHCIAV